jgi:hypothetical protein
MKEEQEDYVPVAATFAGRVWVLPLGNPQECRDPCTTSRIDEINNDIEVISRLACG